MIALIYSFLKPIFDIEGVEILKIVELKITNMTINIKNIVSFLHTLYVYAFYSCNFGFYSFHLRHKSCFSLWSL